MTVKELGTSCQSRFQLNRSVIIEIFNGAQNIECFISTVRGAIGIEFFGSMAQFGPNLSWPGGVARSHQ